MTDVLRRIPTHDANEIVFLDLTPDSVLAAHGSNQITFPLALVVVLVGRAESSRSKTTGIPGGANR